jgi:hypothetical protein
LKQLQSVDDLKDWETYREHLREALKLLGEGEPAFISKLKFEFEDEGKPWMGHVVLVGKKVVPTLQRLKRGGVLFREGVATRERKDLRLADFNPKLCKEARRTFLKLKLGYRIVVDGAEDGDDDDASESEPKPARPSARDEAAWKKLKAELLDDAKARISANDPKKARIVELVRQASAHEKSGDLASAIEAFEELRDVL